MLTLGQHKSIRLSTKPPTTSRRIIEHYVEDRINFDGSCLLVLHYFDERNYVCSNH